MMVTIHLSNPLSTNATEKGFEGGGHCDLWT
jgi:hypothetical protein